MSNQTLTVLRLIPKSFARLLMLSNCPTLPGQSLINHWKLPKLVMFLICRTSLSMYVRIYWEYQFSGDIFRSYIARYKPWYNTSLIVKSLSPCSSHSCNWRGSNSIITTLPDRDWAIFSNKRKFWEPEAF
jgi:hypothetical protein